MGVLPPFGVLPCVPSAAMGLAQSDGQTSRQAGRQAGRQAAGRPRAAGRHRRPRRLAVWGRSLRAALARPLVAAAAGTSATMSRLVRSTRRAQLAALSAEVVALRVTMAEMRDAVVRAEARAEELAAELAVAREMVAAP